MGNRLFIVSEGQSVKEMSAVKMQDMSEAELQEIVEKNPELLSRAWDDQPRKLYLISREQEVFADEDEGNMFSLDHLLVDSEGVPILVEVKRSTDTRTRREVAAQMLDYACRAKSWDVDKLKSSFRENNKERTDAEALFDDETFWGRVSANLGAEHFRLVFVADRIPETLRILIEFMDRAMNNIEVYGVELKPYKTVDGTMLLSSNIVGNSLDVRAKPTYHTREKYMWTREAFLTRVREKIGDKGANAAETLIELCPALGLDASFGKGETLANFMAKKDNVTVFQIGQAYGKFQIYLTYSDLRRLGGCKGQNDNELRDAILKIFPAGTDTRDMVKNKQMWIPLSVLAEQGLTEQFGELIRSFL